LVRLASLLREPSSPVTEELLRTMQSFTESQKQTVSTLKQR